MTTACDINTIKEFLQTYQQRLIEGLEKEEPQNKFLRDAWTHHEGGGGLTCVLEKGQVIEKGGVNFSHVTGKSLPAAATAKRPQLADCPFQALGVSVVIHPLNPYVPTSHLNVRFIMVEKKDGTTQWWFGGGFDLTPYYGFAEDCVYWHRQAQSACLPFGKEVYQQFKQWCDEYFYLKHRQEPRGIGGIFFDEVHEWGFEKCFQFMQSVAEHYMQAYLFILHKRKTHAYGEREREFQCYRRGRYVEFNLLYDRGTFFGLQSGGRTESILVSLPPSVIWPYQYVHEDNSVEANFYRDFLQSRNWV